MKMTPSTRRTLNNKTITSKELWEDYPQNDKVSLKQYKQIVRTFAIKLAKTLVNTGDVFRLPSGAGLMSIIKRPQRKDSLNFNVYRLTGERQYFTNLHSDGYNARYMWRVYDVSDIHGGMHLLTKFKPSKEIKRILHLGIVNDNTINLYYDNL